MTRMSDYIMFYVDVIIYSCPNFNDGLANYACENGPQISLPLFEFRIYHYVIECASVILNMQFSNIFLDLAYFL